MKQIAIFSLTITALLFSCGQNPLAYDDNTHGRGNITFYVEQNLEPLFETSISTFQGLEPEAHIKATYDKEIDIINAFIDNKTKAICISREFTKQEIDDFRKAKVEFKTDKVVLGSIALIGNSAQTDSVYNEDQIKAFLISENATDPVMVFDGVQSANFNYFQKLIAPQKFGKNVRCLNSNKEVIDYIKNNQKAIGVVGFNWLSDMDDKVVLGRLKDIRILGIAKHGSTNYGYPNQYYVFEKIYPYTHYWYIHNKGSKDNLEAGFTNFMISEKGQLLVKKCGLLGAYRITREFQITTE